MYLRALELEEFRSYHDLALTLDPGGLRLFGPNTGGKTTLLEAIAMLATTRSPRSVSDRELIAWESGRDLGFPPFARARGAVVRRDGEVVVEIALQTEGEGVRKHIKLGGRPVRAMDAVGTLKVVLFSPDDVALVTGPPSGRRRYLDLTISQLDGRYLRALSRYGRILVQRNSLLRTLARDRVDPTSTRAVSQLAFWDDELVAFGSRLVAHRLVVSHRLAELADERHRWLTGGRALRVVYRPSLALGGLPDGADLERAQATVARDFGQQLGEARRDEIRRGVSLIGPHRDDLGFSVEGVDLATYGSRGQQRLAVIALKLAETMLMEEAAGEPPVLLLDDVLSELDAAHRELLISAVARIGSQVIITATDEGLLEAEGLRNLPQARVEGGAITAVRQGEPDPG